MPITSSNPAPSALDALCINTLRFLAVDTVQQANSGHPGLPLGAAAMAYVLWTRFLKLAPDHPQWFNRDRFVLSAGHGSALLYSLLHLTGFDLPLEQLQQFRQWGSITPGHPERGTTEGVEVTTGPLGQGFGNGVGMAIAEAHLAACYNRDGFNLIDHHTYGIVSDGDLMEGVASEAAALAGHLRLGKLIYLYDDNRVTLSAGTDITFTEDRALRFQAYGWHTQVVDDGNDLDAIEHALCTARTQTAQPSLILVRTHLGFGSPNKQDTYKAHGSPLGTDEVERTKSSLGWPQAPAFYIPASAAAHFKASMDKGRQAEEQWNHMFRDYERHYPTLAHALQQRIHGELPEGWDTDLPQYAPDVKGMATRTASGQIMNAMAARWPALIGGSADLDPSTHTELSGMGDFEAPGVNALDRQGSAGGGWSYAGRNLHFGVREHAMGAIINGIAAHGGAVPFGATFLVFSDYMRPAIRLAALMRLHVIYVFTHDSLALGEDGATHQPIEQIASLRAIPHLTVIRPADANETIAAWRVAVTERRPVALVLTRQDIPTLRRDTYAGADGLRQGAYVLADAPNGHPRLILMGSGSEVSLLVDAHHLLLLLGVQTRVVSMPSWELFDEQTQAYRDTVLPPGIKARLSVEAGVSQGWRQYVGDQGDILAIDRFGTSAPGERAMREYGFTVQNICQRAITLLHL
ncbi:transketolase [Alcaligenaceae bacterium CGII-47]|nr:transketolase [Alcaligenaceae bacterium CGII-47]